MSVPSSRIEAEESASESGRQKPLGERFLEAGLLTESQLDLALREQRRVGGFLGEILVQLGFVSSEAITEVLASQNEVDVYDVRNAQIDASVLDHISYETAKRHCVIPVALNGDVLVVAFADSFDVIAMDQVERECGRFITVVTAPESHIIEVIERSYTRRKSINETIESVLSSGTEHTAESGDDTPMVRLVDQILGDAIKHNASDIHFHAEEKNVRVRLRVDGVLHEEVVIPKPLQAALIGRVKLIGGMNITEKRVPQDGRIRFNFGSSYIDLRVSTLPTNHGESVVMRVLDSGSVQLSLDQLGFSDTDRTRFENAVSRSYGMVLVTGPTGSGKTTTLYTALSTIDYDTRSVFTLEDPIEYSLPAIRQTQINDEVGMNFAAGLRALLRQDPDVILVGEIRDLETAELATRAALTGHTVFSTLHTNSAIGAISRLIDMGIDRYLIPSALVGVVGQRLLRRLCPVCKTQETGSHLIFDEPRYQHSKSDNDTQWVAVGCEQCNHTGYKGRLAVYEVLILDETMHHCILNSQSESELLELATRSGMTTLIEDGLKKANQGHTTVTEVLRVLR
ncbi:MAG: GspE/PulE family protein [Gammaproteobacteria bacterium]|nr:GspE/PulE family protein [Gammaproteobacteria bacterium]